MALAMQSNCFSLKRVENVLSVIQKMILLPGREVLATLRHGRV